MKHLFKKGYTPWNKGKKFVPLGYCMECSKVLSSRRPKRCWNCWKKYLPTLSKGKKRSDEFKKNLGKRMKRMWADNKDIFKMTGEQNVNWKGGITPENEKIRKSIKFREWRKAVFERDDYSCLNCEKKGEKIHSHHRWNFAQYPERRFDINNGTTFCKNCHLDFHKEYGKTNNTGNQILEFIGYYNERPNR